VYLGDNNQFKYCVATQDKSLRTKLGKIPGVPLIYIKNNVVILEPPSFATVETAKKVYTYAVDEFTKFT